MERGKLLRLRNPEPRRRHRLFPRAAKVQTGVFTQSASGASCQDVDFRSAGWLPITRNNAADKTDRASVKVVSFVLPTRREAGEHIGTSSYFLRCIGRLHWFVVAVAQGSALSRLLSLFRVRTPVSLDFGERPSVVSRPTLGSPTGVMVPRSCVDWTGD